MPRLVRQDPRYRKHKHSGQAVVTLGGRTIYLGAFDTEASRREYDRLVGEWRSRGRPATGLDADGATIIELAVTYRAHAAGYYSSGGEQGAINSALDVLVTLYGTTDAAAFGPMSLRAVRDAMVGRRWCRNYVNQQVGRLRQFFKWATEREMIPPAVLLGLQSVVGLKRGRTDAHESEPVRPVSDADVDAIRPHVSAQVWAMVRLQRITGMRPGEVVIMRACDVERADKVWTYTPATHKTEHHGHTRAVYLGPRAQEILLERWVDRPDLGAYLFQPAEAEAERLAALHAARSTPAHRGNGPGTNRRPHPKTQPGDHYTVDAYRRAITRACESAFGFPDALRAAPEEGETAGEKKARLAAAAAWRRENCWHPHQLRHTAGTNIRREFGLEAAQVVLGHRTLTATQVYAERNIGAARRIMGDVG